MNKMEKSNKYFAYGSNLNVRRLYDRCPEAIIIGKSELRNYRLSFMGNNSGKVVANIFQTAPQFNESVAGVVFELNKKDKATMDAYEGYPYVYDRISVEVELKGKMVKCFTYVMYPTFELFSKYIKYDFYDKIMMNEKTFKKTRTRKFGIPTEGYLNHIVTGYNMFGLNVKAISKATEYSGRRNRAEWKIQEIS